MTFAPGDTLPSTSKGEITRDQLRQYASASGDVNPIHLDEKFAKDAGFPSVIAHGMLSMAFLGDYILEHFSSKSFVLSKFKVRFKRITFPGDHITCVGKIRDVDEVGAVTVSVATQNQKGEETTSGEATLMPVQSEKN